MGHDQTYEGYGAGERNCRARDEGSGGQQRIAGESYANSQRPRLILADHQQVEIPGHEDRDSHPEQHEGKGQAHLSPARSIQSACKPEEHVSLRLQVLGKQYDGRDDGGNERPDGNTREQQRGHGETPADGGHPVYQGQGSPGAGEGHGGQRQGESGLGARGNGYDRAQGPAGGNADDAGIGHRVAKEALHHRSGNAQSGANDQRKGNAGHADRGHNGLFRLRRRRLAYADLAEKDVDGVGQGDVVGTERDGGDHKRQPD